MTDNDFLNNDRSLGQDCKSYITLGVCGMNRKINSPTLLKILSNISNCKLIQVKLFEEDVILYKPIEEWPVCDALLACCSSGFPLEKAMQYAELHQPHLLNDLKMHYTLMDRVKVYQLLAEQGIDVPRHQVYIRDELHPDKDIVEDADYIEINGVAFFKPFVEKPVDGRDHNINIYYPTPDGGGTTKLFRKVEDRSSTYFPESRIRRTGSYLYEDFIRTNGIVVKVYVVGPDYAHAQARKSPALDGSVQRNKNGKEIRYPVMLNAKEKTIANIISKTFKLTLCAFDLLRSPDNKYVCDVSGFSVVKNSPEYIEDCSIILQTIMLDKLAPKLLRDMQAMIIHSPTLKISSTAESEKSKSSADFDELRCVIAVMRHGDRTPKQKMKMVISHPRFTELYKKFDIKLKGQIKLKKPQHLQDVLSFTENMLEQVEKFYEEETKIDFTKLALIKDVLVMYGKFSGINRKIQIKMINQLKSKSLPSEIPETFTFLFVMKWGGELTAAGIMQAEALGRKFRKFYPGEHVTYNTDAGSGLLRLHSTLRHDLKLYSSDEGRVQTTAAAFAKGLLELRCTTTSILANLVKRDQGSTSLLDITDDASKMMADVKTRLHSYLRIKENFSSKNIQELAPTMSSALVASINKTQNPTMKCSEMHSLIKMLIIELETILETNASGSTRDLYHSESLFSMIQRWKKLEIDFSGKSDQFNLSEIPAIYDSIKYDILHNSKSLNLKVLNEIHEKAKPLADIVIPQEYGITKEEKLKIAQNICNPLLNKILGDIKHSINNSYSETECYHQLDPSVVTDVITRNRNVRSRLYFTSESHVHSLFTIIKYGGLFSDKDPEWKEIIKDLESVTELNYVTHFVFQLFEVRKCSQNDPDRFYVNIYFSCGAKTLDQLTPFKSIQVPRDVVTKLANYSESATADVPEPIDPITFKAQPDLEILSSIHTEKQLAQIDLEKLEEFLSKMTIAGKPVESDVVSSTTDTI